MSGNLTSALAIPLSPLLRWDHAKFAAAALPAPGDLNDPFDPAVYANRDNQLAYRDLIVSAAASKLAMLGNDLFGGRFTRIMLPVSVVGHLSTVDTEFGYSTPGAVRQVTVGDAPLAALQTDVNLTERDALIYYLLYRAAQRVFSTDPLAPLDEAPANMSDAWSLGGGQPDYATVSAGWTLEPALFNRPDFNLAARDNQLAAWASRLVQELLNPLARASRAALTAATSGQIGEAEFFNLRTIHGLGRGDGGGLGLGGGGGLGRRFKVLSGWPIIPDRYQLIYDTVLKTVDWRGEADVAAGSAHPVSQVFVTAAGSYVALSRELPPAPDCEYYRQKSARLVVRPYEDVVSLQIGDVENYAMGGAVYQLDGVVLAKSGAATFSVPAPIQAGVVRIGLLVQPVRTFDVLGFQNTLGLATDTAVDFPGTSSLVWAVPVPAGRYYLSATFSDPDGRTQAFPVRIYYNNTLVFDGSWAYNLPDNQTTTTQSFEFNSIGGPAVIRIERLDSVGSLRLEKMSLTSRLPADLPVQYSIGAQLGIYAAPVVALNGVLERTEAIFFDIATPEALTSPTLTVSFYGAAGVSLHVYGYDTRTYQGTRPLPDAEAYEGAKATLLSRAAEAVARSWVAPPADFSTPDPVYGRTLDYDAYQRWLNIIRVKQPRVDQAFQVAGPGDVGRPALIPAGLQSAIGGTAQLTKSAALSTPVLHVCQPWMVFFGVLVAGPDFWPLPFCACESVAGAVVVTASFDFTITDLGDPDPSISGMTSDPTGDNSSDGDNFTAYSLFNRGPGGGYNRQYCTLTVFAHNLRVGVIYTVALNLRTVPEGGGPAVLSTVSKNLTATADVGFVVFDSTVAADGYLVEIVGATLS